MTKPKPFSPTSFAEAGSPGSGIPRRRSRVARPLLEIGRTETREFATLAGLPWQDDPTNDETDALRNRIRHRPLPALEADYNLAIRSALVGLAQLAGGRNDASPGGELLTDGWRIPNSMLWAAGPNEAGGIVREALRGWRRLWDRPRGNAKGMGGSDGIEDGYRAQGRSARAARRLLAGVPVATFAPSWLNTGKRRFVT